MTNIASVLRGQAFTATNIIRAINSVWGNIGANRDDRDWTAIMASADPLAASEIALVEMYQNAAYLIRNSNNLRTLGYTQNQIVYTYHQLADRLGFNYNADWAIGTAFAETAFQSFNRLRNQAINDYEEQQQQQQNNFIQTNTPTLTLANDATGFLIKSNLDGQLIFTDGTMIANLTAAVNIRFPEIGVLKTGQIVALSNANLRSTASTQTVTLGTAGDDIYDGSAINTAQFISTGDGNDTITGGAGADTIFAGDGNDIINGGAGADVLNGGDGDDTFRKLLIADFAVGEVVNGGNGTDILSFGAAGVISYLGRTVSSVETLTLTANATNEVVVTQGSGLLTINNLAVINATLTINHAGTVFAGAAQANVNDVDAAGEWHLAAGANNNVLTIFDQVTGQRVAITFVDVNTATRGNVTVAAGNLLTSILGALTLNSVFNANAFTIAAPITVTGSVTISATGVVATTDNAMVVTQPFAFNQANITSFSLVNLTATQGTTSNFAAAVSTLLTTITGFDSADNFVFDTAAFGRSSVNGGATVNGGAGVDTITITPQIGTFTVFSNTANQQNIIGIENITLSAGNAGALILDASVTTVNNGSVVNVRNASTTLGSTVNLGSGAAHTFTSISSGDDTVTLGFAGQRVTVSGGGRDEVITSLAASRNSSFTGSVGGTNEILTFTSNLGANAETITRIGPVAGAQTVGISNVDVINLAAGNNNFSIDAGLNVTVNTNSGFNIGQVTTIRSDGSTIRVVQNTTSNGVVQMAGSSNFSFSGGDTTGLMISKEGDGRLSLVLSNVRSREPFGTNTRVLISSESLTTIDAEFVNNYDLVVRGPGNFTITKLGNSAGAVLRNHNLFEGINDFNRHTGTTHVITGALSSTIQQDQTSGALTVDTALLGAALIIGADSTGAITINGLSLAGSTVTFVDTANTISATITGTDANARTINTGAGADNITITNVDGNGIQTINTFAGNDLINLTGTTGANIIIGGAGADTMTGGAGADVFSYTAVAQGGNVATAGATAFTAGDTITNFVSGTDVLSFAATATGTAVVTSAGAAINLTNTAVVIVNTSFNVVNGTTTFTNLLAALNTAAGGNFRFSADLPGAITYFAILDENDAGAADDQYNIFEVTTLFGMGGATLVDNNVTASLIATLTVPALIAGDFIFIL